LEYPDPSARKVEEDEYTLPRYSIRMVSVLMHEISKLEAARDYDVKRKSRGEPIMTRDVDRARRSRSTRSPYDLAMDDNDPITQFFPDDPDVDLYSVFSLESSATAEDIKKSYRRLALIHHPDKHATSGGDAKAAAQLKFQQIGFAYTILGDDKRRKRYDATGRTDEGLDFDKGEDGWEAYFEELFEKVTRGKLDEMKKEYQGMHQFPASSVISLPLYYRFGGGNSGPERCV
jgi:hypothetical protein